MTYPIRSGTWILVADSEKAMFLRNVGDDMDFDFEVLRKDVQDNPASRDQGSHPPGRFNDGPSVQRSAVDDTDWHRLEKARFAADLAEHLYRYAHGGRFDEIVIVAAPALLGDLRNGLHPEIRARIVAEIDKNLTHMPIDELETYLARHLGTGRDSQTVDGPSRS